MGRGPSYVVLLEVQIIFEGRLVSGARAYSVNGQTQLRVKKEGDSDPPWFLVTRSAAPPGKEGRSIMRSDSLEVFQATPFI